MPKTGPPQSESFAKRAAKVGLTLATTSLAARGGVRPATSGAQVEHLVRELLSRWVGDRAGRRMESIQRAL